MGTKRKNPSSRGVPENLKTLARKGKRIRFNGFWLNDTDRDRLIADWLDQTPQSAAIIKDLIYRSLTGQIGYGSPQPDEYSDEIGEVSNALLDFED